MKINYRTFLPKLNIVILVCTRSLKRCFSENFCHTNALPLLCSTYIFIFAGIMVGFVPLCSQGSISEKNHESEAETIAKCIGDLQANDDQIRKRAVLILGKYPHPLAQKAVIGTLRDTNPSIRRSALVALTEKSIPYDAMQPILRMIGDEDVHVKRIASSYLPELMRYSLIFRLSTQQKKQGSLSAINATIQGILLHAFHDRDAIVRRNMMANYSYFRHLLSEDIVRPLLQDSDRDVRSFALVASKSLFPYNIFLSLVQSLVKDPDRRIRMQLVTFLKYHDDGLSIDLLKILAEDKDIDVSTTALAGILSPTNTAPYEELKGRLIRGRMSGKMIEEILKNIPKMGKKGEEALREIIQERTYSDAQKRMALDLYFSHYRRNATSAMLLPLMEYPSEEIRQTAAKWLARAPNLNRNQVEKLVTSRYPDVRKATLLLVPKLSRDDANHIMEELILDDVEDIRVSAIQSVLRYQVKGWEWIAKQSLEEEPEIQENIVRALIHHQPGKELLSAIAKTTSDETLRKIILRYTNMRRKKNIFSPLEPMVTPNRIAK